ncbi:hypothetical protein EMIHUDRAFT_317722 [Emiliania huxleyi CCMP1516]|uniref:Uncharacterized protein n=2 Tax=Emiliania huxleyi TaxID=2903 RepID=A0A0D3KA81_EMIH1|nr:hypothetical protein EMIHUDRAFT_317722 [Emiliania huxleyi CCMP1516]EOD32666.1 hypothetical protein EMIHUDRAFT_317722 [Emiliania huxleyi CCMP1516]|eukprot:XP_005785095.1 hypothetical protein EMIHUDRAFT_317722 [Emiliania huxleyi CCMP1516]
MPHKVKLDPRSIKNPMLRLDCRCGPWCTRERGRRVAPAGDPARLRPARRCVVTAPWQECGEELAEREQQMAKKELAVTRCRAVVVLWRLCTVGKVRLQQGSTLVVPCCSLA